MNILKSTTALALALGLGVGLAAAHPAFAADKAATEKTATEQTEGAKAASESSAQQASDSSEQKATEGSQASIPGGIEAEELIGRSVVNKNGEEVGEVEGLVIQPQKEKIHAVLSIGGFLGIGDREVAIPLEEFDIGGDNVTLMSQQTKEELEALPEYEESEWQIWQGPATVTPQEKSQ